MLWPLLPHKETPVCSQTMGSQVTLGKALQTHPHPLSSLPMLAPRSLRAVC